MNKSAEVGKVTEYQKGKSGKSGDSGLSAKKCIFCGRRGHSNKPENAKRKAECPAWDQECFKCEEKGHFGRMC